MSWLRKAFRHVQPRRGTLAVGGLVERPSFGLTFQDLLAIDAAHQVKNVGAYAAVARVSGPPLHGVRLKGIFELCCVEPEAIHLSVANHAGFKASLFRREVEPLAIVVYARDGLPLDPHEGGPFRLVIPGSRDEASDIHDLALLEPSDRAGEDVRARAGPPGRSTQPGEIPGLQRKVQDPNDPRSLVSPPPV